MLENNKYKISVITAVYNAELCIQNLIESLRVQKDKDFEWVVVDGASTDRTLEILNSISDLNIRIISEPDFGIYDALNKGIKLSSAEYYLVAGADDVFYENAIYDYSASIDDSVDIVTGIVHKNGHSVCVRKGGAWLFDQCAYITCHSLGTLVKKNLHFEYGFYSRKFPIAADQFFIMRCCENGAKIIQLDTIVGQFGTSGVSSEDTIGTCTEKFRVQLLLGKNKWIQFILLVLKIFKRLLALK